MKSFMAFFGESFVPLLLLFVAIIAGTWHLNGVAEGAATHVRFVEVAPAGEEWSEELLDETGIGERAFDANTDPSLTLPEVVEARKLSRSRDFKGALERLEQAAASNAGNLALANEIAVTQLRLGENAAAVAALEKVVASDPGYFRAWYNLGVAHTRMKNLKAALDAYEKSSALRPQHFETAHNMGLVLLQLGRGDEALSILEQSVELAAGDNRARAWFSYGVALGRAGREEEALSAYRKSIEYRPGYLLPRYNRAVLFASRDTPEDLVRANETLEEILKLTQEFPPAWFLLGRLASRSGDGRKALEYYDRAAKLSPGFWKARYNAAFLTLHLEHLDAAEQRFTKLAADWPDRPEPLFNLGQVASKREDFVKAEKFYVEATKLAGGTYPEAEVNQGLALREQRKYQEALAVFDALLARDATNIAARMNRALVLMSMERFEEARAALRQVIQGEPGNARAWYNLGKVEEKAKDHKAAAAAYEKVLELDHGHLKAAVNLGIERAALGDPAGAVEAYRKALEVDPNYAPAWYNLGVALRSMEKLDEAAEAYRKVQELDPENRKAFQNLGVIYSKQNRLNEAIAQFEAALALDAGDVDARFNLALQLRKQQKEQQAKEELRRVLRLKSTHRKAAGELASLLMDAQEYSAVVELLEPFVQSGKASEAISIRLAQAYGKLGRPQDARAELEKALKKSPASAKVKTALEELGPVTIQTP